MEEVIKENQIILEGESKWHYGGTGCRRDLLGTGHYGHFSQVSGLGSTGFNEHVCLLLLF